MRREIRRGGLRDGPFVAEGYQAARDQRDRPVTVFDGGVNQTFLRALAVAVIGQAGRINVTACRQVIKASAQIGCVSDHLLAAFDRRVFWLLIARRMLSLLEAFEDYGPDGAARSDKRRKLHLDRFGQRDVPAVNVSGGNELNRLERLLRVFRQVEISDDAFVVCAEVGDLLAPPLGGLSCFNDSRIGWRFVVTVMAEQGIEICVARRRVDRNLPCRVNRHRALIAFRLRRIERAAETDPLRVVKSRKRADVAEEVENILPRSAGDREPIGHFIQTPFGGVPGHLITAERTHPEFKSVDRRRAAAIEVGVSFDRAAESDPAPGQRVIRIVGDQAVARRLLPLKDGRKLFAAKRRVGRGFVPSDTSHRMFSFAFGEVLIEPFTRPRQRGAVAEERHRLFKLERSSVFDERMFPEFRFEIAARIDELFVFAVCHFIFVNEEVIELDACASRLGSTDQSVRAARNINHAFGQPVFFDQLHLEIARLVGRDHRVSGLQQDAEDRPLESRIAFFFEREDVLAARDLTFVDRSFADELARRWRIGREAFQIDSRARRFRSHREAIGD
ncbi:MAG: hypothetical protein JMDDDDMK_05294 [Acidobacteria bacterium]|nr:hypothetical protein [Acidobacteriota bacterium]